MRFVKGLFVGGMAFMLATSAFALPGIKLGLHANLDQYVIDEEVNTFTLPGDAGAVIPNTNSTLVRSESSRPVGLGVDLTITALPIIDLMVTADAAFGTYDFAFNPPAMLQNAAPAVSEENISYIRVGVDASIIKELVSFPPAVSIVNIYAGVGPTMGLFAPVIGRSIIEDNIQSATEAPDPKEYAKETEVKVGFHVVLGARIKAPALPGLHVFGKYYVMGGLDDPNKSNWMTLGVGLII